MFDIEQRLQEAEDNNLKLARALLSLADSAGMPDTYKQSDSRMKFAREILEGLDDRESAAYKYLDDKFEAVHYTSVPRTDEDAVDYFSMVQSWFGDCKVTYIMHLPWGEDAYKMLPWRYDADTGEVHDIGKNS